jgi:ABC-type transporter Mla MlaB component
MPPRATNNPQERTVIVVVCGDEVVTSWALPGAIRADLGLVDELARLQLTARRFGCCIRLRHVDPQLSDLLHLSGLGDVVAVEPPFGTTGAARYPDSPG